MPVTPPSRLREFGFHHAKAQDIRKQIEIEGYIHEMAKASASNPEINEETRRQMGGTAALASIRVLALQAALGRLTVPGENKGADEAVVAAQADKVVSDNQPGDDMTGD